MGAALALPQPAKAGPDGRIGGSTDVGAAAAQSAEVSGPQFWNSEARPQRPDPRSQASERARWPIPTHAPSAPFSGQTGFYVGHLTPGTSLEYSNLTVDGQATNPTPSHGYWLVGSDGGIFSF